MINDKQKNIYNSFLRASRIAKNQPFTQRSKFDNLDPTKALLLKKLEAFFNAHISVRYNDFFIAPYFIYNKDDYFDLQFFVTRKAIKCYTEYVKRREVDAPDSDEVIKKCKECCAFIYYFCKEAGITLKDYKSTTCNGAPLVLQHVKEHKLNFYTLHGLEVSNIIPGQDLSLYNFMFENFYDTYNTTRLNFIRSTKLKNIVRDALKLIDEKLLILNNNSL